jgi:hypothetical protein
MCHQSQELFEVEPALLDRWRYARQLPLDSGHRAEGAALPKHNRREVVGTERVHEDSQEASELVIAVALDQIDEEKRCTRNGRQGVGDGPHTFLLSNPDPLSGVSWAGTRPSAQVESEAREHFPHRSGAPRFDVHDVYGWQRALNMVIDRARKARLS